MSSGGPRPRRDVEWADGIRGIASLLIVTSHCTRAFIPNFLSPADDVDVTPHLFQRPFFRMTASGPFWMSIFFLLSGYVCAIKPIRLARAGQAEEARRVIASSAFRRIPRIVVPATLGTLFAWVLAQVGAFTLVPEVELDESWLSRTTPKRIPGFYPPIEEFFTQCFNTWAIADNKYEANQWSLAWEMRGSMLLFLGLTIAVSFTNFWRRSFLVCSTLYFFKTGEFISPFLFFSGALLAEISLVLSSRQTQPITPTFDPRETCRPLKTFVKQYWAIGFALFAIFIGSFPPEGQHRAAYSRFMWNFFEKYITPRGGISTLRIHLISGDNMRTIAAFGGIFLIFAILFSPRIRRFLSNSIFVFLGSISFPLYLLHGTFIRLPLAFAFFEILPYLPFLNILEFSQDSRGDPIIIMSCTSTGCRATSCVIFFIWLVGLLAFCRFWKSKVDILGVHFSRWAEDVVLGKREVHLGPVLSPVGQGLLKVGENLSRKVEYHDKGCHGTS